MKSKKSIYELQTAPSTVRIRRDEKYLQTKSGTPIFCAAKGQHVSFQVILRAASDISSFNISVSDLLHNQEEKIFSENVSIFVQKYLYVNKTLNDSIYFPTGYYPDPLIPINNYPLKEQIVKKDNNQGFWLTVFVPKETKSGDYDGEVMVTASGEQQKLSFTLRVANTTLPEKCTMRTAFCLRYDLIKAGEGEDNINLRTSYYEFLLNYRINSYVLPMSGMNAHEYAQTVSKYFDHPHFTAYGIPSEENGNPRGNVMPFREFILALAKRSTQKTNLLSKAYTYFYDEPEAGNHADEDIGTLKKYHNLLKDIADEIEYDPVGEFREFKEIKDWKSTILNIPSMGTFDLECGVAELLEKSHIWCPSFVSFDTKRVRERGFQVAKLLGAEVWWYGCMGPLYPFPTYHLVDRLISSRLVSWMQSAYGIKGNLYWDTAGYTGLDKNTETGAIEPFDPYISPYRAKGFPAGEGILMYPGKPYDYDNPVPSIRLMSIRDGMEEFELLERLKEKYRKLEQAYSAEGLAEKAMNYFYRQIFNKLVSNNNYEHFEKVREGILDALQDNNASGFAVGNISTYGLKSEVTLYLKEDYSISINGAVCERSGKFNYKIPVELQERVNYLELTIISNTNEKIKKQIFVEDTIEVLNKFDPQELRNCIKTEGASKTINVNYGRCLELPLSRTIDLELVCTQNNYAVADIPLSLFKYVDLKKARRISFTVYNAESRSLTMFVRLNDGQKTYADQGVEIFENRNVFISIEWAQMRKLIDTQPQSVHLQIRSTYPKDFGKDMRILIGGVSVTY